jgi:N-acetylmuramic acid 6-phosphate (MurNAc-6-P) etherase
MVDLRATNAKLRDRAIRIVSSALECDAVTARELLEGHDWNIRRSLETAAARSGGAKP